MRTPNPYGLVLVLLLGCGIEEFGVGSGSITVKNDDGAPVELMVSDSETCFAGTRSTLQPEAVRDYSVAPDAWLCVGSPPRTIKVADGGRYVIRGGAAQPE